MSILEVSDEVTSILSRKGLTFQDNLEELPFRGVGSNCAVLMVDVGWVGRLMAQISGTGCVASKAIKCLLCMGRFWAGTVYSKHLVGRDTMRMFLLH
jgi:hypothetical protein